MFMRKIRGTCVVLNLYSYLFMTCCLALLSASDKKVMHFLACNSVAFNVVSSPTFRGLFAMHNKIDQLKSEKYYRETVLPQMYAQVKARVKCVLKDCTAVSFTTDVWSGPTASYMR